MPDRPRHTVIYDADCGFCRWCLGALLALDRDERLRPLALGTPEADGLLGGMSREEQFASWHIVDPRGRVRSAGAALPTALRVIPGGHLPADIAQRLPGLSERAYTWVAGHRGALGRLVGDRARARADARIARRERAITAGSG